MPNPYLTDPISQLIQKVADHLTADPWFSDIPVITEIKGDVDTLLQQQLGLTGTCAWVLTPTASMIHPNMGAPSEMWFDEIAVSVRIFEVVEINRGSAGTGKAAIVTAETVCNLLNHYDGDGQFNPLAGKPNTLALGMDPIADIVYDVQFQTNGGMKFSPDQVATPTLTVNGTTGAVTLTCSTPGAAIFYTTNGLAPSPRTTLYTVPFTPDGGVKVRARGWLAGYLASLEASQQF